MAKKKRPKIDRSYYNSDEFKRKLQLSIDAALADEEYQKEIAAWHITIGDGLENRE